MPSPTHSPVDRDRSKGLDLGFGSSGGKRLSYGALDEPNPNAKGAKRDLLADETEALIQQKLKPRVPILIENPDGTIAEGIPPGYKEKSPRQSPRIGFGADGLLWGELAPEALTEELSYLYTRHERLFILLVVGQCLMEISFLTIYVLHSAISIAELEVVYGADKKESLTIIFWILFGAQLVFSAFYYTTAGLCIWEHKSSHYKLFATLCLVGIAGQVLLAYINKFNLLIFFLRLLSYIYSKFLKSLTSNMLLLGDQSTPEDW